MSHEALYVVVYGAFVRVVYLLVVKGNTISPERLRDEYQKGKGQSFRTPIDAIC